MMGNGSGSRPLLTARAVKVPLTADSVAPPRLAYGGLDLASDAGRDDSYTAIYFTVAGGGSLGRVTFEGLDAIRAARGETLPNDIRPPRAAGGWVFTVDKSPWLAERHHYEMQRYSTALPETHQHYTFQFHDEFAEAVAEGIWLDLADPARPYGRPARHPLANWTPDFPVNGSGQPRASNGSCGALPVQTLSSSTTPGCAPSGSTSSIWSSTGAAAKGPVSGCVPETATQSPASYGRGPLVNWPGTGESPIPATSQSPGSGAYLADVAERRRKMGR